MRYRRGGLGLIGLLTVVALGVMAFASSAQALTPEFLIAKKLPAAGLNATVGGVQVGVGLVEIPALGAEINCTEFEVLEGVASSSTDGKLKLLNKGCTVLALSTGEEATGCEIVTADNESPASKQVTASFLVLPTELTNGTMALLAEGIVASILTRQEQGCVLPTTTKIKGEVCFRIKAGTNDTVEPLVESNLETQKECVERTTLEGLTIGAGFKDKVLFGSQEAFFKMTASLFLTGAHKGLTLGVSLQ